MPFRNTKGIVTEDGNPGIEADVIMTAATLGFAASYIAKTGNPIRFDMDPLDEQKDSISFTIFSGVVARMTDAIDSYLTKNGIASIALDAGYSPAYGQGAVIMGVYKLAGQTAPDEMTAPVLTEAGQKLYDRIKNNEVPQYTGRGGYTGFVDNHNTDGDTDPVGPRSTARFLAPAPGQLDPDPHPRWLPPSTSKVWDSRKRADETFVPWGLIGGDSAGGPRGQPSPADQTTNEMADPGMVFNGAPTLDDIAVGNMTKKWPPACPARSSCTR